MSRTRTPWRKILRRLARTGVVAGALIAATGFAQSLVPGYPDDVFEGDPREMAMIPRYCAYALLFRDNIPGANNPAEIKRWYSVLGPTFHHVHHYCAGLIKTNRAVVLAKTGQHRQFYLKDSILEFNYVIRSSPDNFVLLPEILTKKGENLVRLGQGARAVKDLERAIALKADYWPSYAVLSDYYRSSGNRTKARTVLEQGLSLAPDAKALKRRLEELDRPGAKRVPAQPAVSGLQ